jgi:peptidyl-prolyl cis-trans isomerase B (cyclophilin B)
LKKFSIIPSMALFCDVQPAGSDSGSPQVRLETNHGNVTLELDAQAAPQTVENFLRYVRDSFYDGTIFHRVIKGFMVQGGGLTTAMERKPNVREPIPNEADNGLKNNRGSVAMARTMEPHSASAQFFINSVDNDFLDHTGKTPDGWGYCVFGRVVEGMDAVDKIERLPTETKAGHQDVPISQVIIKQAVLVK